MHRLLATRPVQACQSEAEELSACRASLLGCLHQGAAQQAAGRRSSKQQQQQAASSKQQAASSKQQAASSKQQAASGKQQAASSSSSKQQAASSKQQAASGKRQTASSKQSRTFRRDWSQSLPRICEAPARAGVEGGCSLPRWVPNSSMGLNERIRAYTPPPEHPLKQTGHMLVHEMGEKGRRSLQK